jgi:asparagine synthase (glutamine-hydrolysing)
VTARDALEVIPELPRIYDEPFADDSQIPTYLLSKLARQHVTVSLSGDGGDELFAGYTRHFAGRSLWRRLRRVPLPIRRTAAGVLGRVPPRYWDAGILLVGRNSEFSSRPAERIQKLIDVLGVSSADEMYYRLVSIWPDPRAVTVDGVEPPTVVTDARGIGLDDFTLRMVYLDLVSYLPDDILVKVDRAAMSESLETRVPYLAHPVVEFAARLPLAMKIRDGRGKWILRETLYRHVPRALIDRPKAGFTLPVGAWLRGPLRDWAEELLSPARLAAEGFLRSEPIRDRWDRHLSGERNTHLELWNVLMFQAWLEAEKDERSSVGAGAVLPSTPVWTRTKPLK